MDTKDQNTELASSEVMLPDSTVLPPGPELADLTNATMTTTMVAPPEKEERKSPTPFQDSLRRLRRDRRAMVSVGIIAFFILLAIIGPPIYQHIGGTYQSDLNGAIGPTQYHTYDHQELSRQDELPSAQYWLGTDDLGRDILARL